MKRWYVSTTALAVVHTVVEASSPEDAIERAAQLSAKDWVVAGEVFGDVDLGDEDAVSVAPASEGEES